MSPPANPRARVGRDETTRTATLRPTSFNPRARVGRDQINSPELDPQLVSIHAPAWGATCAVDSECPRLAVSIHAPAWGATTAVGGIGSAFSFQSTRPRGARHVQLALGAGHLHVSIHAPAWGATRSESGTPRCAPVSIHAPAWGATCGRLLPRRLHAVSIHAPAWGATRPRRSCRASRLSFNPRARVGRVILYTDTI